MKISKRRSIFLCICGGAFLLAGILLLVIAMTQVTVIGGASLPTLLYLLHGVPSVLLVL